MMKIRLIGLGATEDVTSILVEQLRAAGHETAIERYHQLRMNTPHYTRCYGQLLNKFGGPSRVERQMKLRLTRVLRWFFFSNRQGLDERLSYLEQELQEAKRAEIPPPDALVRAVVLQEAGKSGIFSNLFGQQAQSAQSAQPQAPAVLPEKLGIVNGLKQDLKHVIPWLLRDGCIEILREEHKKFKEYIDTLHELHASASEVLLTPEHPLSMDDDAKPYSDHLGREMMRAILSSQNNRSRLLSGLGRSSEQSPDLVLVVTSLDDGYGRAGAELLCKEARRALEAPDCNRLVAFLCVGVHEANGVDWTRICAEYVRLEERYEAFDGFWPLSRAYANTSQLVGQSLISIIRSSLPEAAQLNHPDAAQLSRDFGRSLISAGTAKEEERQGTTEPLRLRRLFDKALSDWRSQTGYPTNGVLQEARSWCLAIKQRYPSWEPPLLFRELFKLEGEIPAGFLETNTARKVIIYVGGDQGIDSADLDAVRQVAIRTFPQANLTIYTYIPRNTQTIHHAHLTLFVVDGLQTAFLERYLAWLSRRAIFEVPEDAEGIQVGAGIYPPSARGEWQAVALQKKTLLARALLAVPRIGHWRPSWKQDRDEVELKHVKSSSLVRQLDQSVVNEFFSNVKTYFIGEEGDRRIHTESTATSWAVGRFGVFLMGEHEKELKTSTWIAETLLGINLRANAEPCRRRTHRHFYEILLSRQSPPRAHQEQQLPQIL